MARFATYLLTLYIFIMPNLLSAEESELSDYQVVTLSAAIIDHYFFITDDQLRLMTNEKGGWAPIDYPTLSSILEKNKGVSKMVPGGSGANVIKGLSHLGEKCAIIGKVGSDDKGEYYWKKMQEIGITPLLEKGPLPTGQAICLITPDGERTFRTYLGASHSLADFDINPKIFEKAKLFHIEGFQLVDPDLVIRTLKMARKAGLKISMDLGNPEIVRRNKEFIHDILDKYIDILLCNEREAKELTGLSATSACDKLSAFCEVVVVTMSERGSWARCGSEKVYMEAFSVSTIDTTGAGDLYASGFLHGYLQGEPLQKCAWMGALVASHVIRRVGAEIPEAIWEEIRCQISEEGKAFD
ncbi:MAG: adenosine kinase [Chlamydiia bacterium]|nr:adenosine kinase [Chlamydiia bacterium]